MQVIKSSFNDLGWNSVLYITRSRKRLLRFEKYVRFVVKNLTEQYQYRFEIFPDNPVPSLNDTMQMFYRAKIIVAPHGAGLSNFIFSRPGSYVIEGICHTPWINSCFLESAYVLGHHYHAIPSRTKGVDVLNVDPKSVQQSLKYYLEAIRNKQGVVNARSTF